MTRRTISNAATATLERWLDDLQGGVLHIGELPLAVEAWLHAGYALGRESRDAEVADLERAVNRWYCYANTTDKERREQLDARLAQALDNAPEKVWDRIEVDLREMRDPQLNTNTQNSLRAAPAAIGDSTCHHETKNSGNQDPNSPTSGNGHKHAA